MFAAALTQLRSGNDGQAALQFTEFVTQYPSHPQAAAAQNYIGEAFYRQRDFRQAAAEFQKTVDQLHTGHAGVGSPLKIGLCQRALWRCRGGQGGVGAGDQAVSQNRRGPAGPHASAAKPGGPR